MGLQVGAVGSQGITREWATVLAQLVETQIWHLPASFVGRMLRLETMASSSTFAWQKAAPPALTLSDTSVPPHVSMVPFKLLPQSWHSGE